MLIKQFMRDVQCVNKLSTICKSQYFLSAPRMPEQ